MIPLSKVYVVTQGEYSDHHVVGVCSTEALAKILADIATEENHLQFGAAKYKEYEVDANAYRTIYHVTIDDKGNELCCNFYNMSWVDLNFILDDIAGMASSNTNVDGYSERSYDAALKAARDHLAQIKAMNEGVA